MRSIAALGLISTIIVLVLKNALSIKEKTGRLREAGSEEIRCVDELAKRCRRTNLWDEQGVQQMTPDLLPPSNHIESFKVMSQKISNLTQNAV
ncbi:hypothetical protein BCR34DRAFT_275239 [Clohesyomyces aquaticus]|uniref:Uncharacterized protein n=1 Tax=Clohesyomyces aquaticus TaxID=1231657 RepID=A0A1Y1ZTN8_9PLEO|nr:hypothetical protein BCR34DRAFT_275239 [Clohesyomyces aquaticus]